MKDFTVGKKEDKLGIRASSTTELILDNCKVPKENVFGEVGKGYKVSIETLNEGRIGIGAQMLGIAQGAYEAALEYTNEREQFGQPINNFQAVQFQLAEMAVEIEATRLLVYNAARLKDAGKPFLKEAAIAKLYSSACAEKVSSKAIELYGGYGYVKDYPVEKFWRDSKIGAIYEGHLEHAAADHREADHERKVMSEIEIRRGNRRTTPNSLTDLSYTTFWDAFAASSQKCSGRPWLTICVRRSTSSR